MKSLEDKIREIAKSGELSHLSLAPKYQGGFGCSYRGTSAGHYHHAEDADPVKAMLLAMAPPPPAPARKAKTKKSDFDFG